MQPPVQNIYSAAKNYCEIFLSYSYQQPWPVHSYFFLISSPRRIALVFLIVLYIMPYYSVTKVMIKIYNTHTSFQMYSPALANVSWSRWNSFFSNKITPANVYILLLFKFPFMVVSNPIKYLLSQINIVFDWIPRWLKTIRDKIGDPSGSASCNRRITSFIETLQEFTERW